MKKIPPFFTLHFGLFTLLFLCLFAVQAQENGRRDATGFVNPFIGTGAHGHTFPGATVPHGFVQLSPDTREANWDGSGGYHYSDDVIYGFSHQHLSGTGIPDYCDVLFMPTLGAPAFFGKAGAKSENGYASKFSHADERAEAGYYSVKLADDSIFAEMTATARAGFHRYTFPKSDEANIILDLTWRDEVLDSELKIVGNNRIEGFRRSKSWAKDQIVYFVAEFSKPFDEKSIVVDDEGRSGSFPQFRGRHIKSHFRFKTSEGEKILLKVGISAVDIEGARKNLNAEIPAWDFDRVRAEAKQAWQKELSQIEVSGGTDAQLTNFYTALYHTKIAPNVFQDVDGRFRGLDGNIHTAEKNTNYTIFSLWDTFRTAHPLYTVIDQKRTVDFINTFLRHYEHGGRLPVWELAANETDTMIGFHAVSVIADAMAKEIKGFDYEKAYRAAKHSAELNHFGLEAYKRRGYISSEDEQESVSKTLEYAYNDWCVAQMARILNKKDDYEKFMRRARNFENLFDAQTGFMRPKQNGAWVAPFAPQEVTFHFTEANSWQYSFFAPQDVSRLIELAGGKQRFVKKLDELFTTEVKTTGREQPDITGLIGQYAHGNEPSHHIAYLYNFADAPDKTQFYARKIMDEFYRPVPEGLIGNEDCGQMSAWYVLSAAGFYPVTPGSDVYVLGTPLFPEMRFNLENGKTFTVKAPNVSDKNFYVKAARLNGKRLNQSFIKHTDIMRGGVLEFDLTDAPAPKAFGAAPVAEITAKSLAVPIIAGDKRVFTGKNRITLASTAPKAQIFYMLDGGAANEYKQPFEIDRTTKIEAFARADGEQSQTAEAIFHRKPNDWSVRIFSQYNRQYTGGGDEGLIDGLRGTTQFAAGAWQGYQAQDFVAVIDLGRETEIKKVGGGFLQVARSWIWMPTAVEFETSNDNVNFQKVAEIKTDVPAEDMTEQIKDFAVEINPTKARFVRVRARNLGKIPAWHPGAGFEAFIFVDEIFVR